MTVIVKNQLPQQLAREMFDFDYESNRQIWKTKKTGHVAGYYEHDQSYRIWIEGIRYKHTNVVWNYFFGPIPAGKTVDHIDTNPYNDDPRNLRLSTPAEQAFNRRRIKKTKYNLPKHIRFNKTCKIRPYIVEIRAYGKRYLNYFPTLEEALEDRNVKVRELHGEFANLD